MVTPVLKLDFVALFILTGLLQAACLGIIFSWVGRRSAFAAFGWVMLTLTLIELESLLTYTGAIVYAPWLINFSPPLILLLGPLSYRVISGISGEKEHAYSVAHFIPAILFFTYSFLFYLQPAEYKILAALRDTHPELGVREISPLFKIDPLDIRGLVIVEGLALHLLFYAGLCWLRLVRWTAKTTWRKNRTHYPFACFWCGCLLTGGIIFLGTGGVVNGTVIYPQLIPGYAADLFTTFLTFATTSFWLIKALAPFMMQVKYSKSRLDNAFLESKLARIKLIMTEQKPFLEEDFSLGKMAEITGMSAHHVSQVINAGTGAAFSEFVNRYRVREAMRILRSAEADQIKVENLAYDLGFRSKSAFFSLFKRETNTTPARYRESVVKTTPAGSFRSE